MSPCRRVTIDTKSSAFVNIAWVARARSGNRSAFPPHQLVVSDESHSWKVQGMGKQCIACLIMDHMRRIDWSWDSNLAFYGEINDL